MAGSVCDCKYRYLRVWGECTRESICMSVTGNEVPKGLCVPRWLEQGVFLWEVTGSLGSLTFTPCSVLGSPCLAPGLVLPLRGFWDF